MNVFSSQTTLGILGGGQLGRMLIQAAVDLAIKVKVLDADADAPCKPLAHEFVQGSLLDFEAVYQFGRTVDILTIEIEHVNVDALEKLEAEGVRVFPQPRVIRIIQDKRTQKQFYKENGIPSADFILTDNAADIGRHVDFLPAFQKLGRNGYDGRGVQRLSSAHDLPKAFAEPGLLEKAVDFKKELSVIVARTVSGRQSCFPVVELVFHPEHNLVDYLVAPARIPDDLAQQAQRLASAVAEKLGIVGLLAVEMFLTQNDELLVNEVAPRPHNSGHHTMKANGTSQFEQHLRAVLGLPLGQTHTKSLAAMVNILGEADHAGEAVYVGLDAVMALSGAYPHLYGKRFTKPFRKMGHVTILDENLPGLQEKVAHVQKTLRVTARSEKPV